MAEFMKTYPVIEIKKHNSDLFSLYFEQPFSVRPGQFINLWLPGVEEKPFSVSNTSDGVLELSIKSVGPFTNNLGKVKKGDFLGIRGPFGNGFSLRRRSLLIGGGIGLAPLRFLSETFHRSYNDYFLLIGSKSISDVIFRDKYQNDINCMIVTEDGSSGKRGLVTDFLPEIFRKMKPDLICASGPEKMLLAVREIALKKSIPFELSFERYMKCSIGVCGQCCMDGSGIRLCVEGPILREEHLVHITELGKPHRTASGLRRK